MIYYLNEYFSFLEGVSRPGFLSIRGAAACAIAFVISLLVGPKLIAILTALKAGQPIRQASEVHKLAELHGKKVGTPTMGGVMIVGSSLVATLLCARPDNPYIVACCFVMVALSLLGFADDFLKVKKKTSEGVHGRVKLLVQGVVALMALCFLYFFPESVARTPVAEMVAQVSVPFYGTIDLGWWIIPFGVIVIIGASNAVNLTDGLDGLASGCTITSAMAYAVIAYIAGDACLASPEVLNVPQHPMVGELTVFAMSLVGACMGFLWFNCHPARVFMGDTGSLALGGALGALAVCTCQELLLVVIGGVFVLEAGSVMMQVAFFKVTKRMYGEGRRIFRMAPIHHHFELGGCKETQVIVRFWMVSLILAMLGLCLLKFC
ncbi:phospho-N-acetylmuramoyl-pentapeptide-transferase [Akkermansia glycaniphila]|uniref:phospho-N-acetylmuramoyl-pentapeptide- transferase n=1 Tax=Akkermansia glycaniphila TaxID=1679444 RepID=UPI001C02CC26|nr:phospho-N-acetylmuramoyl-pentapeptide-transferase [Akkermansia glycaniphila]MBT9448489.1 phospho-N-acetylmuramoyl-pentapeptide-transferase [Akkermansia glycaniphila]